MAAFEVLLLLLAFHSRARYKGDKTLKGAATAIVP